MYNKNCFLILDKPPENKGHSNTYDFPNSYQMKSSPRGIGIIVNNKIFTCGMMNREGTDKDATALQRLFTYLDFYTYRYNDLTGNQLRNVFNEAAAIDYKKFDCLMVAILTHSIKNKIYGTDGELIPVEDLTKLFSGYHCPSLIGKPKIFLLQGSRGGKFDYGVEIGIEDDSSMNFKKKDITINSTRQFDTVISKALKEEVESKPTGLFTKYLSLSTVVGINKENYGFQNFFTSNNDFKTGFR